jgi:hypothetical protein
VNYGYLFCSDVPGRRVVVVLALCEQNKFTLRIALGQASVKLQKQIGSGRWQDKFLGRPDGYTVISEKLIEPVVVLGRLEELLTGRAFEAQLADPESRACHRHAERRGAPRFPNRRTPSDSTTPGSGAGRFESGRSLVRDRRVC